MGVNRYFIEQAFSDPRTLDRCCHSQDVDRLKLDFDRYVTARPGQPVSH
jgi:hypothetical protein